MSDYQSLLYRAPSLEASSFASVFSRQNNMQTHFGSRMSTWRRSLKGIANFFAFLPSQRPFTRPPVLELIDGDGVLPKSVASPLASLFSLPHSSSSIRHLFYRGTDNKQKILVTLKHSQPYEKRLHLILSQISILWQEFS